MNRMKHTSSNNPNYNIKKLLQISKTRLYVLARSKTDSKWMYENDPFNFLLIDRVEKTGFRHVKKYTFKEIKSETRSFFFFKKKKKKKGTKKETVKHCLSDKPKRGEKGKEPRNEKQQFNSVSPDLRRYETWTPR